MDIKAVILAAGKGTRMKSETTPKVLHQIMGKTLLGYVLDNVKNFVSEEYVIVGHHAQEVENCTSVTATWNRSCCFYGMSRFTKL